MLKNRNDGAGQRESVCDGRGAYCLMHSGIDTYSMGTSSARSVRLYTYLIFWLNFEL